MAELGLGSVELLDGRVVDVMIDGGQVTGLGEPGTGRADRYEDLAGHLLLPGLADPHAHLDKALSGKTIQNATGDLMGAIEAWMAAAPALTVEDITDRATRAARMYLDNGVTHVRTHTDIGEAIGLRSVEALTGVREEQRDMIDLQVVGLVMYPLTGAAGATHRRLLGEAIGMGIDLVGGAPALDPDPERSIDILLDAGAEAGLGVDLHIDETLDPTVLTLEHLARRVIERGFPHPVTAGHCVSLGVQPPERQRRIAELTAQAGISVVTNPQTNLYLQAWGVAAAPPRGLTAIEPLRAAGVVVAGGGDNLRDPFNPLGRADPLETASLLVTAGHVPPLTALAMVSSEARRVMGLATGIEPGAPADLVALRVPSVRAAVAGAVTGRRTYRNGSLVSAAEWVVRRPGP